VKPLWISGKASLPLIDNPPQQNDGIDELEKILEENWLIWCDFLNNTFVELNIYLPAFYIIPGDNNLCLEIETCSKDSIDQNSLVYLH
jgi:hypothetical protein